MKTTKLFALYVHIAPNDKKYFGITSKDRVENRWGDNGDGYCTQYFYRAIQKYGWDNFQHIVLLEGLSKEVACECEKYLIAKYHTNNPEYGYNLSAGGDLVQLGLKRTPEQIKHISDGHRGLPLTQKQIDNLKSIHAKNRGKPISDEVRLKISIANTGKKRSDECKKLLSERMKGHVPTNKGVPLSEETKEKLRQINLNKTISEETRKKISENNAHYWKGKKRSEETKQKISQALIGRPSCRRGSHMSEESKYKLSEKQKERLKGVDLTGANNGFYGKHHTPETIEKIRQASIRNAQIRKERKLQNGC